jgi:phosphohistidine phosphatase SixA
MKSAAIALAAVTTLVALAPCPALAQERVFVIRHAEKQAGGDDPALTEAGRARARAWAAMLGDAGIDVVLTTDARRTRETGGLIAEALGTARAEVPMADVARVVDLLSFEHADDTALVVGHTETIPGILSGLGLFETVTLAQEEFATLYIVVPDKGGEPALITLHMP